MIGIRWFFISCWKISKNIDTDTLIAHKVLRKTGNDLGEIILFKKGGHDYLSNLN